MTKAQPIETIPVSDRDADNPIVVLVWVSDADRGKGRWAFGWAYERPDGTKRVRAHGFVGDWNITAWAPLPEPPDHNGDGT